MQRGVSAELDRVRDGEQPAFGLDDARVAHLAAHLGVERRVFEDNARFLVCGDVVDVLVSHDDARDARAFFELGSSP